jgi:uncharacterized protein (DUF58 family)
MSIEEIRWSKVATLFFAAFFIFVVAVRLNIGQMYLMAGTLAAAPLVSALLGRFVLGRVRVLRDAPGSCFEKSRVFVRISIQGPKWLLPAVLSVRDTTPYGIEVADARMTYEEAPTFIYTAVPQKRGVYEIGPVCVYAMDPMGMVRVKRLYSTFHRLVVYPRPVHCHLFDVDAADGFGVQDSVSHLKGGSAEFHSTREYSDGDELKRIHWPSTARRGRLVVVERVDPPYEGLLVALDLLDEHPAELKGFWEELKRDLISIILEEEEVSPQRPQKKSVDIAARVAAGAVQHSFSKGVAFGLLLPDDTGLSVPVGSGELHYYRVLKALAKVEANSEKPLWQVLSDALLQLRPSEVQFGVGATDSLLFITDKPDLRLLSVLRAWVEQGWLCYGVLIHEGTDASSVEDHTPSTAQDQEILPPEQFVLQAAAQGIKVRLVSGQDPSLQ